MQLPGSGATPSRYPSATPASTGRTAASSAAAQDSFCAGTVCTITRLYDQSGHGNDLGVGPVGGNGGPDAAAIANALPVKVGGHPVYGVNVQAGVGYRNDVTNGVATGSQPQGAYMVTSGTHVDSVCCFDFGNAETSGTDTGNGHMDAINFGTECWFTPCTGSGPWVQADLENGLFAGGNGSDPANKGNSAAFVTAIMNNNGTSAYAIKDANARPGSPSVRDNSTRVRSSDAMPGSGCSAVFDFATSPGPSVGTSLQRAICYIL